MVSVQENIRSAEVSLIPWLHEVDELNHVKVLDFIRTLSPKAVIALEIPPYGFNFRKRDVARQPLKMGYWGPWVDVILAAQRKGIKIVPIESVAGDTKAFYENAKHGDIVRDIGSSVPLVEFREKAMTREIVGLFGTKKLDQLYVITGAGHTAPLAELLKKQGLNPKINLNFLPLEEKVKMQKYLKLELERRKAHHDNSKDYGRIEREIDTLGRTFSGVTERKKIDDIFRRRNDTAWYSKWFKRMAKKTRQNAKPKL